MGITKTDLFSDKQNKIATLVKALGHPARVAIVEYLLSVDACICGDIVKELPLSQPTISQHLRELKNAGIIKGSIEGTSICYCIDDVVWTELLSYFNQVSYTLGEKKKSCC